MCINYSKQSLRFNQQKCDNFITNNRKGSHKMEELSVGAIVSGLGFIIGINNIYLTTDNGKLLIIDIKTDNNTIEIITNIKYLLKDKGMTIKGVKKMLNNPTSLSLDEDPAYNVNTSTIDKKKIKIKVNKIINILKELNKFKDG